MRLLLVKALIVSILFICQEINYRKAEHPYAYIHFVKLWYMSLFLYGESVFEKQKEAEG